MTDPMFVCNVSGIPRTYVPCRPTTLDGQILDPNELSVSNAGTLPFLNTQFDMDLCFSVCKYYRAPAAGAGVGAGQVAVNMNMNMNRGGNVQMGNINPQQQQQMFAQQQQQQTMQAQQQLQAQQQEAMRVQQMHQQVSERSEAKRSSLDEDEQYIRATTKLYNILKSFGSRSNKCRRQRRLGSLCPLAGRQSRTPEVERRTT